MKIEIEQDPADIIKIKNKQKTKNRNEIEIEQVQIEIGSINSILKLEILNLLSFSRYMTSFLFSSGA